MIFASARGGPTNLWEVAAAGGAPVQLTRGARSAAAAVTPAGGGAVSDILRVNPIACDAHGLCAELVPELIRLDEWGYPIVAETPVPARLSKHAKRAVAACPALALLLTRSEAAARSR